MYVCLCEGVSDSQIRQAVAQGANTVAAVGERTCAGTDCGACHSDIEELIAEHACSNQRRTTSRVASHELKLAA